MGRFSAMPRVVRVAATLALAAAFPAAAFAAPVLTVAPLTWNIIGLDSNDVNDGPNKFPVGARVCNTGDQTATGLNAQLVFDSMNPYIDIRPGTGSTISLASLDAASCHDFYFEVEVTRDAAAYDTTIAYHINVTGNPGLQVSTPLGRELYVERLISQNRNSVDDILYGTDINNLASVGAGGSLALVVGTTYFIQVVGSTATQGYEQLESFLTLPNTIFRIHSVETSYSADTSVIVPNPNDRLYADGCGWDNDVNSPNYQACLGVGKAGGDITITYEVEILQVPSMPLNNPEPLTTMIYDFSGSSFHYNADFGVSARFAYIVDPTQLAFSKSFNPAQTVAGGESTLTFTISNPVPVPFSDINFEDFLPTMPGAMVVADPPQASTTGCGTPTFAPNAGDAMLSFSDGSVGANSNCVIRVSVVTPTTGQYDNLSDNLFVGTIDTGKSASAKVTAGAVPPPPSGVCGATLALWNFADGFTVAAPEAASPPTVVTTTAAAGAGINEVQSSENHTVTPSGTVSWGGNGGFSTSASVNTADNDYFEFAIDTTGQSQVDLTYWTRRANNGPDEQEIYFGTSATPPGTFKTSVSGVPSTHNTWEQVGPISFTTGLNAAGLTYFRIYAANANNDNPGSDFLLDDVKFTGCVPPAPPEISKGFAPAAISTGSVSTLTFTLTNPNDFTSLTGVSFTDDLPSGLEVAATPNATATSCGSPTWAPAASATSLSFSGGTIAASGTCTVTVDVVALEGGQRLNVSSYVGSTNGGTNTTQKGIATAPLTVLVPPQVAKKFDPNPILANGISRMTLTLTNPNQNTVLAATSISDTYPTGMVNAATPNVVSTCSPATVNATGGDNKITATTVTIPAGGECTISVDVTVSFAGTFTNTTAAISDSVAGTGKTASDTLTANLPNPSIGLLKQVAESAPGPGTVWGPFVAVPIGGNVFYRFTIENTGDSALSGVTLNDPDIDTSSCTWVDGDGNSIGSAPFGLPVAIAATNAHIATCTIGPVTALDGSVINTATAAATGPVNSGPSSATYGSTLLTLSKVPVETSFTAANEVIHYNYHVLNMGNAPLRGPVTVTDNKVVVVCPAVNTVGDKDEFLDIGESLTCTSAYTVKPQDVTAGFVENDATASADGASSSTVTASVPGPAPVEPNPVPASSQAGLVLIAAAMLLIGGLGMARLGREG